VADTLSRPFGTKSAAELEAILQRNLAFILSHPVKMVVIACHTACCSLSLYENLPIPVLPIFPTSLGALKDLSFLSSLLIMGTQRTIASGMYQEFLRKHYPHLKTYYIAASVLEHLIEKKCKEQKLIETTIAELVQPLQIEAPDGVFLACTHFPIYQFFLQKMFRQPTLVLDPAEYFSRQIYGALESENLLNPSKETPTDQYVVTGDLESFQEKFLCYFGETLGRSKACFSHAYAKLSGD